MLLLHSSIQTELLIQAQLTRESAALSPALLGDFRRVLELAPRLLEELMKVIFACCVLCRLLLEDDLLFDI